MAYTDVELAAAVAAHDFEVDGDGRPLLPASATPLGQRLYDAVIRRDGRVNSALGPLAAQALTAKGFQPTQGTGGRWRLPRDTPRASGTRQPGMTDAQLAAAVAAHDFEVGDDGRPVLPASSTPLGKRLGGAVITNEGAVYSALGPLAAHALTAKGFQPAQGTGGRRGLPRDTPRAGIQARMTDAELAAAVAAHDFEVGDDGRPVLPAGTTTLGQRLYDAVIRRDGSVHSALGPLAAHALTAKGFQPAQGTDGRWRLPSDTPRASIQARMTDAQLAAAVAAHDFKVGDDGRPLLPPATTPLGKRLHSAVIRRDGRVYSALGLLAAQALAAKGFQPAQGTGGRLGLSRDTSRTGIQARMTDAQLAAAVAAHDFEVGDDGRPVLPASATTLGQRLYDAVIRRDGRVHSELGPLAAHALAAKGFQPTQGTGGRLGLPSDTPLLSQLYRVGEADALRAGFADARPGTQPEPTGSAQQLSPYRTEIIATMIYEDYQQLLYHGRWKEAPHWPEIPPSGLKVAVAHEGTESGLGQGPIVVTLDVPGDAHEPVGGSGRPAGMTDEIG
ncbi:hypothetical protein, partial [Streptomyces sp. NPDC097610]|uniref:hypothetical protein n=1 Tax=Streptomyces sp. NPDC097610 TaxID=3157227 RepID=UPI00332173B7